jgi:hypothetical protein
MSLRGGRLKLAGFLVIIVVGYAYNLITSDNTPAPPPPPPVATPDMINLPIITGGNITWNSTPCDGYSIFYWNDGAAPTSYENLLTKFSIDKPYYNTGDYVVVLGTLWTIPPTQTQGMIVVPYNLVVDSDEKVYAVFVFSGGVTYSPI